jgi:hypothetical protein
MADDAFRKGHDREAFQYVYGAALASDEAAERLPQEFRWVAYLKKPAMAIRWGFGITYKADKNYTGHPSPLGYVAPPPPPKSGPGGAPPGGAIPGGAPGDTTKKRTSHILGQRDRGNNNQPGAPGTQPGANSQPEKPPPSHPPADAKGFLEYYTGEVGEKVLDAISTRITKGDYGLVLQHAAEIYESPPPTPSNAGPSTGLLGGPPPGSAPPGGAPPGMSMTPGGANNNEKKPETFQPGAIMPGVVMLGEGSESELLKTAGKFEVDFVIVFEVSARKSGKDATNNTKFHVVSVDKAKSSNAATTAEGEKPGQIFSSAMINSHRVESARDRNEADPLEAEIGSFVQALDRDVKTIPLTEKVSTPEIALKRAAYLAAQTENKLANLAEIRCYVVSKLIGDKEAAEFYAQLIGNKDKADKLARGTTEAERAAVLAGPGLLPKR